MPLAFRAAVMAWGGKWADADRANKQTNKQTKRVGVSALLDTAGRSGRASEGAAHDRCHAKLTLWIDPSIALETCYNNRPFPSSPYAIYSWGREGKRGQFSKYAGAGGLLEGILNS